MIYADDKWGQASGEYYNSINLTFNRIAKRYKMPTRMPPALYSDIVSENDLVIVILEHIREILETGSSAYYEKMLMG